MVTLEHAIILIPRGNFSSCSGFRTCSRSIAGVSILLAIPHNMRVGLSCDLHYACAWHDYFSPSYLHNINFKNMQRIT